MTDSTDQGTVYTFENVSCPACAATIQNLNLVFRGDLPGRRWDLIEFACPRCNTVTQWDLFHEGERYWLGKFTPHWGIEGKMLTGTELEAAHVEGLFKESQ